MGEASVGLHNYLSAENFQHTEYSSYTTGHLWKHMQNCSSDELIMSFLVATSKNISYSFHISQWIIIKVNNYFYLSNSNSIVFQFYRKAHCTSHLEVIYMEGQHVLMFLSEPKSHHTSHSLFQPTIHGTIEYDCNINKMRSVQ